MAPTSRYAQDTAAASTQAPSQETVQAPTSQALQETVQAPTAQPSQETVQAPTSQALQETVQAPTAQPSQETVQAPTQDYDPAATQIYDADSEPNQQPSTGWNNQPYGG